MILHKIKSVILGHAVADALGVPVEFSERCELEENPVTDMRGYGTYNMPEGCWSDDTSMTLAALDSLASGVVDYDEIMTNFGRWYHDADYTPTGVMFDVGGTCRSAILRYTRDHLAPLDCGLTEANANGNGSLMRILPFSLYAIAKGCDLDDHRLICEASALTHAHERSKIGCGIYHTVLAYLLEKPCKDSVYGALGAAKEIYANKKELVHYVRMFQADFADLPPNKINSTGYVVDTLEAAVWCLLTTDSYAECVLKAVNLGEDTDTVAAVAGGLAGALYGLEGIPQAWLGKLKKSEWIEEMCERAAANWADDRE